MLTSDDAAGRRHRAGARRHGHRSVSPARSSRPTIPVAPASTLARSAGVDDGPGAAAGQPRPERQAVEAGFGGTVTDAVAGMNATAWQDAGIRGAGVRIGIIDFFTTALWNATEQGPLPPSATATCSAGTARQRAVQRRRFDQQRVRRPPRPGDHRDRQGRRPRRRRVRRHRRHGERHARGRRLVRRPWGEHRLPLARLGLRRPGRRHRADRRRRRPRRGPRHRLVQLGGQRRRQRLPARRRRRHRARRHRRRRPRRRAAAPRRGQRVLRARRRPLGRRLVPPAGQRTDYRVEVWQPADPSQIGGLHANPASLVPVDLAPAVPGVQYVYDADQRAGAAAAGGRRRVLVHGEQRQLPADRAQHGHADRRGARSARDRLGVPQPGVRRRARRAARRSRRSIRPTSPWSPSARSTRRPPTSVAAYSSQGPTNDGRIKPDIAAPSCVPSTIYGPCFAGTSASSPAAAGVAALLLGAGLAHRRRTARRDRPPPHRRHRRPRPGQRLGRRQARPAGRARRARRPSTPAQYHGLTPTRILDTRPYSPVGPGNLIGAQPARGIVDLPVTGGNGVPAVGRHGRGRQHHVGRQRRHPLRPGAADAAGHGRRDVDAQRLACSAQPRPNFAIVPVGVGGQITLYMPAGGNVVVDLLGWFGPSTGATVAAGRFVGIQPERWMDSREPGLAADRVRRAAQAQPRRVGRRARLRRNGGARRRGQRAGGQRHLRRRRPRPGSCGPSRRAPRASARARSTTCRTCRRRTRRSSRSAPTARSACSPTSRATRSSTSSATSPATARRRRPPACSSPPARTGCTTADGGAPFATGETRPVGLTGAARAGRRRRGVDQPHRGPGRGHRLRQGVPVGHPADVDVEPQLRRQLARGQRRIAPSRRAAARSTSSSTSRRMSSSTSTATSQDLDERSTRHEIRLALPSRSGEHPGQRPAWCTSTPCPCASTSSAR